MNHDTLQTRLAAIDGIDARRDEPLSAWTTYKIGGPAAHFVIVDNLESLQAVLTALDSADAPFLLLGNGSNILFADAGFAGTVIKLGAGFSAITLTRGAQGDGQHLLEVGAATSINKLLRFTKTENLAGVEALGGVPATIGGAVRMNAGTRLGAVKDTLLAAQVARANEPARWVPALDLGLAYRHSNLDAGAVVTAARFVTRDGTPEMRERLDHVLAYRKSSQPLQLPSCGSVFANPPNDAAGRLIEACGLKGLTIGGAQVSELHANWIVNLGGATAANVRAVIDQCIDRVQAETGITLRHEVRFLGDWQTADASTATAREVTA
ncbi:MAG: UDP-N-acetylmuramate dehydrogenase [Myxococcota bacterium]|jgi:UDP-N-acetylmuramate dehydrogenase